MKLTTKKFIGGLVLGAILGTLTTATIAMHLFINFETIIN